MRQKRLKTERVPKTNLPFCFTKNLAGQFWLTVLCTRKILCDKTPLQPLWPKFSLYSWSIFYVITLTIFISRFCGKNNRTTEKANSPLEWYTPKISTTNDTPPPPHHLSPKNIISIPRCAIPHHHTTLEGFFLGFHKIFSLWTYLVLLSLFPRPTMFILPPKYSDSPNRQHLQWRNFYDFG